MPDSATTAVIVICGALLVGHWIACIHERRRLRRECNELRRLYGYGFNEWWDRR